MGRSPPDLIAGSLARGTFNKDDDRGGVQYDNAKAATLRVVPYVPLAIVVHDSAHNHAAAVADAAHSWPSRSYHWRCGVFRRLIGIDHTQGRWPMLSPNGARRRVNEMNDKFPVLKGRRNRSIGGQKVEEVHRVLWRAF